MCRVCPCDVCMNIHAVQGFRGERERGGGGGVLRVRSHHRTTSLCIEGRPNMDKRKKGGCGWPVS